MSRSVGRHLPATFLALALLLVGCDGRADNISEHHLPAEARQLEGDLPPTDPLALEPLYGEALAALGVELTARGGLIDRNGTYEVSAEGTHLALYVAPIGERTNDEYVDGIVELAKLLLPDVFDRWPGLETFDICQEAPQDNETAYVSTITQLDLWRSASDTIDWERVELADLLRASEQDDRVVVRVMSDLRMHPRVAEARREARNGDRDGWGS